MAKPPATFITRTSTPAHCPGTTKPRAGRGARDGEALPAVSRFRRCLRLPTTRQSDAARTCPRTITDSCPLSRAAQNAAQRRPGARSGSLSVSEGIPCLRHPIARYGAVRASQRPRIERAAAGSRIGPASSRQRRDGSPARRRHFAVVGLPTRRRPWRALLRGTQPVSRTRSRRGGGTIDPVEEAGARGFPVLADHQQGGPCTRSRKEVRASIGRRRRARVSGRAGAQVGNLRGDLQ
jgi:hypothetical protein